MISESEFNQRREAFKNKWSFKDIHEMQIKRWCKRTDGKIDPNCIYSWLFADTEPDQGIGGGATQDGIGSVGSFFSYKDFQVYEENGKARLADLSQTWTENVKAKWDGICDQLDAIYNGIPRLLNAFELGNWKKKDPEKNLQELLSFLDVYTVNYTATAEQPAGTKVPFSLDKRIIVALAFAMDVTDVIVPLFTREWIEYAAGVEETGLPLSQLFAKIYLRRQAGESFYDFYCRLVREHEEKSMLDSLRQNRQIVLTGAPGTGKTYLAREHLAVALVDRGLVEKKDLTAVERDLLKDRIEFVQFHGSYDYSDFIVGLKPVLVDEQGRKYGADACVPEGKRVSVSFEWRDGLFKRFAEKAMKAYRDCADKEKAPAYVLVVDEINRADLSRVFGEAFSGLETEYRSTDKRDFPIRLQNGSTLRIPPNLYLIGTMNDIDRSVESLDFAIRRRFAWFEVSAKFSEGILEKVSGPKGMKAANLPEFRKRLVAVMQTLNAFIRGDQPVKIKRGQQIALNLGSEYELGGAIFKNAEKYPASDVWDALWDNHLRVVLGEYLRGERFRAEIIEALRKSYRDALRESGED